MFWDNTNKRLGIGTNLPQQKLDVVGNANITSNLYISGNVGIGTTSPAYPLDVRKNLNDEGSQIAYVVSSDNIIASQTSGGTWEQLNWTLEGFKFNSGSYTNLAGVALYIKRSTKAAINGWIRVRLYSDSVGVPGSVHDLSVISLVAK